MCALVTGVQTCARPICMPRSEIDAYTKFVGIYGAKGLAYIKVNDAASIPDGLQSPIVKNIHTNALTAVIERTGAQSGDLIFFGADRIKVVNDAIRSEEHTSELQSLMRISYAVFCLKKKIQTQNK